MSEPTATIELITPKMASDILKVEEEKIAKGNYRQRTLRENTIHKYVTMMKANHWLLNNQGLGFDQEGNLIDGRHRLWAVKKANVPVKFVVVRGIPEYQNTRVKIKGIDTIDCGMGRTIAQQLQIDGVPRYTIVGSAIRAITHVACALASKTPKLSSIQIREILRLVQNSMDVMLSIFSAENVRAQLLGVLVLYHGLKPRKAEQFAKSYVDLTELRDGSPVIAMKRYFSANHGHSGSQQVNSTRAALLALTHWDEDSKVTNLRYTNIGLEWMLQQNPKVLEQIRDIAGFEQPKEE